MFKRGVDRFGYAPPRKRGVLLVSYYLLHYVLLRSQAPAGVGSGHSYLPGQSIAFVLREPRGYTSVPA